MSYYLLYSGFSDQIGGVINLPPLITHIPRLQGNTVTLPSGLSLQSGGRSIEWALVNPPIGVLPLTNINSPTPTITFDLNTYNGGDVQIKCYFKGNSSFFKLYTLGTRLTNILNLGYTSINTSNLNINGSPPSNVKVVIENSSASLIIEDINYTGSFRLQWGIPVNINSLFLLGYIIEQWDTNNNNNWINLGFTTNNFISVTNYNTSYRVKCVYSNSIHSNSTPTYSETVNREEGSKLLFGRDSLPLIYTTYNNFDSIINQANTTLSFFTEIINLSYLDIASIIFNTYKTNSFIYDNTIIETRNFFIEQITNSPIDICSIIFNRYIPITNIDQAPTNQPFRIDQIGV